MDVFSCIYICICVYNDVQCNIDIRDYIYIVSLYTYIYIHMNVLTHITYTLNIYIYIYMNHVMTSLNNDKNNLIIDICSIVY